MIKAWFALALPLLLVIAVPSSVEAFVGVRSASLTASANAVTSRGIPSVWMSSTASASSNSTLMLTTPPVVPPPASPPPSSLLNRQQQQRREWKWPQFKAAASKVATGASFLCLLDCTVLPIMTLILPFASSSWLCSFSHTLALNFVVPVASLTLGWNYATGHQNKGVAALGLLGVTLIGLANVETFAWAHPHHRIINVVGCGLLLLSNYAAQQLGCDCGLPFCKPKAKKSTPTTTPMMMQTRMIQYKSRAKTDGTTEG